MATGWWKETQIACLHERQFTLTRGITPEKMPWGTLMTLLCFPHSPSANFSPPLCTNVCIVNKRPRIGFWSSGKPCKVPGNQKKEHPTFQKKFKVYLAKTNGLSFLSGVTSHLVCSPAEEVRGFQLCHVPKIAMCQTMIIWYPVSKGGCGATANLCHFRLNQVD